MFECLRAGVLIANAQCNSEAELDHMVLSAEALSETTANV